MTPKERIEKLIEALGIPVSRFEKTCGLANGYMKRLRRSPSSDKLEAILRAFPMANRNWLITGQGEMFVENKTPEISTRPFIPVEEAEVAAGSLSEYADTVDLHSCDVHPMVPTFGRYEFTIMVRGDSMLPDFRHGDEIALRRILPEQFIPGRIYVLDSTLGAVLKRVYDAGDQFRCISINPEYDPFSIDKTEVNAVFAVVGLIRNIL